MAKGPRKRIALAQNFLKSSKLARRLVAQSSIGPADTVVEIGPGGGIITAELARVARQVIAIEKDPDLSWKLRHRFAGVRKVVILQGDFLAYHIRQQDYKILASIPFNLTGRIVRKILRLHPGPSEAWLVVQREVAEKLSGARRETQASILAKPWWDFAIKNHFRRGDFHPTPHVDVALLHLKRRQAPLIGSGDAAAYRQFVRYGFGRWRKNLKAAFKQIYTYKQWVRLSRDLKFPITATATELSVVQWIGLFECFRDRVSVAKQSRILRGISRP